jgi:hypothetical protein
LPFVTSCCARKARTTCAVERKPDMIISIPAHANPGYLTGPHRYLAGPEVIANLRQIRGTDEPEVPERLKIIHILRRSGGHDLSR